MRGATPHRRILLFCKYVYIITSFIVLAALTIRSGDAVYLKINNLYYLAKPCDKDGSCGNILTMGEVGNDETKKGKHFIMKVNGKQGEEIRRHDKVKIITATPLYTEYDIAYSNNYYVYYDRDDKIDDENVKEWVISGDVQYGGQISLRSNDKSINNKWVIEKAETKDVLEKAESKDDLDVIEKAESKDVLDVIEKAESL